MIGLFHAYRAANRGDGWLVSLAQDVIEAACGDRAVTFALDPTNMPGETRRVLDRQRPIRASVAAGLTFLPATDRATRSVVGLPSPDEVSFGFGVGGAYLRSNDRVHELVVRSHQLPQLDLLAELGDRAAYLPISIGPFRSGLRARVEDRLRQVGLVAVRDDVSARELGHLPNVVRIPDLAVLNVGQTRPERRVGEPGVVAVAVRALSGSNLGMEAAASLAARGRTVRYGIQSSVGRTNDDTQLYASAGVLDEATDLPSVLGSSPAPSVVIAGRLHAALHSIAAGFPTIHIGYERKSWGAYRDLGLDHWVVNAWDTSPDELVALVDELEREPGAYWESLLASCTRIDAGRTALIDDLARRYRSGSEMRHAA